MARSSITSVLYRALFVAVGLVVLTVYITLAVLTVAVMAWLFANPPNPVLLATAILIGSIAAGILSYRLGATRLLAGVETRELPAHRAPALYRRRDRLCQQLGIDPPSLHVGDIGAPNALSIGGPRSAVVVFDRRLFHLLTTDELEGILAHELAHVEGRDAFVQTLAVSVLRTLSGLAFLALLPVTLLAVGTARASAWVAGRPDRSRQVATVAILGVELLVGLVFSLFTLALLAHSRRREFAADARAAALTGRPRALARALVKIHRAADPSWGLRSLLTIHGEETDSTWRRWVSTHPPVR
ncbi:MAG: M48 family metalloprotease [Salinirussus sp.]